MAKEVVYICNGILHSHKKEWNNNICSNTDGPRNYHTKSCKSEKDKYYMIITYMWTVKKKDTNEHLQNRVIEKTNSKEGGIN